MVRSVYTKIEDFISQNDALHVNLPYQADTAVLKTAYKLFGKNRREPTCMPGNGGVRRHSRRQARRADCPQVSKICEGRSRDDLV